jgi:hypothetical protein
MQGWSDVERRNFLIFVELVARMLRQAIGMRLLDLVVLPEFSAECLRVSHVRPLRQQREQGEAREPVLAHIIARNVRERCFEMFRGGAFGSRALAGGQ